VTRGEPVAERLRDVRHLGERARALAIEPDEELPRAVAGLAQRGERVLQLRAAHAEDVHVGMIAPAYNPAVKPEPRVLLVDGSTVVRHVLVVTLRQIPEFLHASIDEAGNGAIALKKMETNRYDLVLSDIRMPYMDGLTFVRAVRQEQKDARTPIVLL